MLVTRAVPNFVMNKLTVQNVLLLESFLLFRFHETYVFMHGNSCSLSHLFP